MMLAVAVCEAILAIVNYPGRFAVFLKAAPALGVLAITLRLELVILTSISLCVTSLSSRSRFAPPRRPLSDGI